MKTKIFTSSTCGINYITTKTEIEILPNIISYGDEKYYDCIEINADIYYSRSKYESDNNVHIFAVENDRFEIIISNLKEKGYDNFLFIINESEKEYFDLLDKYKDDNRFNVIKTKLYLYPLAYTLVNIEKYFLENFDMNKINEYISNMENRFKIYFYVPSNNIIEGISDNQNQLFLSKYKDKGLLYDGTKDGLLYLKKYKNRNPYNYMIKAYIQEAKEYKIIPFILYSKNRYSAHINNILKELEEYKNIIITPLSIAYGLELGNETIGLGFIIDDIELN